VYNPDSAAASRAISSSSVQAAQADPAVEAALHTHEVSHG
jgi:hypothetical protein